MGRINEVILSTKSISKTVLPDQTGITQEFRFLQPSIAEKPFSLYPKFSFAGHKFVTLGRMNF